MLVCLRRSIWLLLLLALSITAYAQSNDNSDQTGAPAGGLCGTDLMGQIDRNAAIANTARANPALYQKMVAASKGGRASVQALSAADEYTFWTLNRVTQAFDQVTAVKVWEGRTARIWVDNIDMNNASALKAIQAAIPLLARSLDTLTPSTSRNAAQGMIANDNDVYGPAPTTYAADWDYKTNFLLTDIKDGFSGSGGYIAGYFSQYDQMDQPGSNMMNLLYIDSHEGISGGASALSSTIAHEFQHLIHYGINPNSEVLFNEGCSEVASIINGYRDRNSNLFLSNTNVNLMRWSYNDNNLVLADYARAMTLVHYLREQYGEPFLTRFTATRTTGVNRITGALSALGKTDTWKEVMKGFAVANYLQTYAADPRYGYKTRLSSTIAKAARTFTGGDIPADTSMSLQGYASLYLTFSKPQGSLKFRFRSPAGKKYAIMAMLTRSGSTTVTELSLDTDYSLGDDGVYDKVVLAFVSLESAAQTVSITAERSAANTLSVDNQGAASHSSGTLENSPNPFSGSTSISFSTATPGPVTLQIFNSAGAIVRTVIDGERIEAGEHRVPFSADGLPNGYYTARLTETGRTLTRAMVVVK